MEPGARRAVVQAGSWVLAGLGLGAAFALLLHARSHLARPDALQELARVPAPEPVARPRPRQVEIAADRGHYLAVAEINGRRIDVLVDTGASLVQLSYEDAREVGIYVERRDFTQPVRTANGVAWVAPVVLESVSIGEVRVLSVPAAVSEPGKLAASLLGMSFLGRLGRVDMRGGVLVLEE
jgi:aspartyl protease family protein